MPAQVHSYLLNAYFNVIISVRGDKVHTQIIKKCDRTTLHAMIKERTSPDSIINSDGFGGYNGLVDFDYKKYYSVHHGKNELARGSSHINGIGSFWGYAKTRLSKFRGNEQEYACSAP